MKYMRWLFRFFLYGGIIFSLSLLVTNVWIYSSTKDDVYEDMDKLPPSDIALVLGTSHRLSNGTPNPYFKGRMKTTADLYLSGKVKHILVSGDNGSKYYNEPEKMKKALIALGVPAEAITLDYAGFRTLDSIVRCKIVFGQDNVIIITQPFHSYRALFISHYYDMNAAVLTAKEIDESALKMDIRESLARMLAVWDLYVIKKSPKFLGGKEIINT